ncbi:MAG: hypothetical protein WCG25_04205 [bacterium]
MAKARCTFTINDDTTTTDTTSVSLISNCKTVGIKEEISMRFANDPKGLEKSEWIKPFESPYPWTIA